MKFNVASAFTSCPLFTFTCSREVETSNPSKCTTNPGTHPSTIYMSNKLMIRHETRPQTGNIYSNYNHNIYVSHKLPRIVSLISFDDRLTLGKTTTITVVARMLVTDIP